MTKEERLQKEAERLNAMYEFETEMKGDYEYVFGIDEAGRGPLCGPVVTGCTVLSASERILWLNDSKKLSEKKREELFPEIKTKAQAFGIGQSSAERIDEINILNATLEAMKDAYEACACMLESKLGRKIDRNRVLVLVDGNKKVPGVKEQQITVISGDAKCPSISAASILAKVTRDHLLEDYDRTWPEYGFAKHKGYGTKEHMDALRTYGPLSIHRKSFIGKLLNEVSAAK